MDFCSRCRQISKLLVSWTAKAILVSKIVDAFVAVALAQGPAPTPAPAPIARKEQVIFELTHPIADPKNFNWFFRESTRDDGAHQVMWEPLFRINYATGQLESWLATKFDNPAPDTWVITLRDGVEW
jgi:peptide/nickel transport system substrate-binding protein